jgi:hypothetical protein
MHPGVKPRRVENVLAPLFLMGQIHQIDNVDAHKNLLACYISQEQLPK